LAVHTPGKITEYPVTGRRFLQPGPSSDPASLVAVKYSIGDPVVER